MDFGQSRLSVLSLGAFIKSIRKNRIAYQPKLVTETSLIVRQYDRLSQQQPSFLFYLGYQQRPMQQKYRSLNNEQNAERNQFTMSSS